MATQRQRSAAKENVKKAQKLGVPGRSKVGKSELVSAIRQPGS